MLTSKKTLLTAIGVALFGSVAPLQVRADTITGTGWKGKGVNSDWSTANNWDATPPSTGGSGDRNLFYGQGYFNAGNNGFTTSNNNLSSWAGYRINFQDIGGQPDVSFTITGNSFTLFDFGGNFPKIENLSNVTQTFTLTSGNTITLSGNATGKTEINPVNGDIVFTAGTKVQINSPLDIFGNFNKTLIFNDVVSGSNPVTLQQNSNVVMNAANTYTGNTNIKAGTVYVGANAPNGSAGALGNSTNAVTLGDTSGTANASLYTNGAFTVGRAVTVQSGNTGTATIGGNTAAASTFSGNINLGTASGTAKSVTLVAAAGGSVDFSGVINENTSVPDSGVTIGSATHTGTVRLSNTGNGYGGVTTVANGATLEVTEVDAGGSNSSIGNSSGAATNLVLNGGTLRYIGGGLSSTNRLFTFDANGATLDANAAVSFTSTSSLVASGTGNRTLTLTGPSNGSLASIIANPSSGTTSVTKSGAGTWTLSGNNTFTGVTTISAGTLNFTSAIAFGNGTVNFNIANGATMQFSGALGGSTSGDITIGTGGGIFEITSSAAEVVLGTTSGTGGMTKTGPGKLSFPGDSSYSGATTITDGTLRLVTIADSGLNSSLGSGSSVSISNGATLEFDADSGSSNRSITIGSGGGNVAVGTTDSLTLSGTIGGSGGLTKTQGGSLILSGSNSFSGNTSVSGGNLSGNTIADNGVNSAFGAGSSFSIVGAGILVYTGGSASTNRTITTSSSGRVEVTSSGTNLTVSGAISGTGGLTKRGSGTLTLTGSNSYNGSTSINAGTLSGNTVADSGSNSAFGAGTSISISNSATLQYTGATASTNRFVSVGSSGDASVVDVTNAGTNLTLSGVINNPGSLTKQGSGILTLSGANVYSGGTTVSQGTLLANNGTGSATGTGAVTVASGGTLAGTGAVTGPVTVNSGGTLSAGASIESLDVGALTFSGTSTFDYEIDTTYTVSLAAAADLVNANGNLSIAGTAILNLIEIGSPTNVVQANTKYTLISYAGTWDTGTFAGRPDDSIISLGVNQFVINYNDITGGSNFGGGLYGNGIDPHFVTLTAIPEASAFVMVGLVMLCGVGAAWYAKRKGIAAA